MLPRLAALILIPILIPAFLRLPPHPDPLTLPQHEQETGTLLIMPMPMPMSRSVMTCCAA
jgi:hypothetical protein